MSELTGYSRDLPVAPPVRVLIVEMVLQAVFGKIVQSVSGRNKDSDTKTLGFLCDICMKIRAVNQVSEESNVELLTLATAFDLTTNDPDKVNGLSLKNWSL